VAHNAKVSRARGMRRLKGRPRCCGAQRQITREATDIVARVAGEPSLATPTWVILSEAAEGGWGLAGTAFGIEEFTALAKKAAAGR
jgi:phenylpyruvate tautomerase PptA (4-oxalocrotonate tautomerase family)